MRLIPIAIAVLLSSCAASLDVKKLQDFTPQSNNFVFLNSSEWDTKFRVALAEKGFKVLRAATLDTVVAQGGTGEIARVYNEAEARYGITFHWERISRCAYNSGQLGNATIEISDLKTNEVLLVIEKGGPTAHCGVYQGATVFEDLATALAANWSTPGAQ